MQNIQVNLHQIEDQQLTKKKEVREGKRTKKSNVTILPDAVQIIDPPEISFPPLPTSFIAKPACLIARKALNSAN